MKLEVSERAGAVVVALTGEIDGKTPNRKS